MPPKVNGKKNNLKAPMKNGHGDCCKGNKTLGIIVLLVGLVYLLSDLKLFSFGVNPWTVVFLLVGLHALLAK
jgi:hypothetical protein